SLSDKDKAAVKALWSKIGKSADAIGNDALSRMIVVYPQTKTYFSHWPSVTPGHPDIKAHGKKVMGGLAIAVSKINDLKAGLSNLSQQHAYKLRVDPANFKILNHCILVVISTMFPKNFTPQAHVSLNKFLSGVALALAQRYR
uniref:Hemoglobin subunit alpha-1 n=1 Tax=Notothenia neglecta TaxID=202063 RepID=HBA1_NOTNE|nr:RecName: Full=Hemoglobin subunit alpha-1; AltName: Full=Alpha-1-globin; AltName: Full=Hemoglobin alpha-1 chain [Notothenia neglecta]